MADHFLSLNLMLREELTQLETACQEARDTAQLNAQAKTRLWIAISDAIEQTPIVESDLEPIRVENTARLLGMGAAKAVTRAGSEFAQQALAEVDQVLHRALDLVFPYLITVDYLMQRSGKTGSPAQTAVQQLQAHWSTVSVDDAATPDVRVERVALLTAAYGLPELKSQLSRQTLPDDADSADDLKERYLQASHVLFNQFFQAQAVKREQAVEQLIVYWFEEVKDAITRALYMYFADQPSKQVQL